MRDTNAVIAVVNEPQDSVAKKLRRHAAQNIFVSSVVMHKLFFAAFNSARIETNVDLIDGSVFLMHLNRQLRTPLYLLSVCPA